MEKTAPAPALEAADCVYHCSIIIFKVQQHSGEEFLSLTAL
jgi:hypothetical protein